MDYVRLGRTGERVSALCLGTLTWGNTCPEQEADRVLGTALDAGVNFIDTAPMYNRSRTEEILGRILRGRRDQLFLATKVHKGVDACSVETSIDESLARMQVDHVDLYLIHWPVVGMRPAEIMEALNKVVQQGKARYVGCCNYPAWLYAHSNTIAEREGWVQLVCNQVPYNLIERGIEVEILPQAVAEQCAILTYRPLAMGLLAGRYAVHEAYQPRPGSLRDARIAAWLSKYGPAIEALNRFAAKRGCHPSHVATAWLRSSPGVAAAVMGASHEKQIHEIVPAFDFQLTEEEYARVTAMFDTGVKEEAGGKFPELRRALDLVH